MSDKYLMESEREGKRLAAKTDLELVREELAILGLEPGQAALDAGCASGLITREMAAAVGPGGGVLGVDISPTRLREAQERALPNSRFLAADLSRLPVPDASFDRIVCRLVLEYAPRPGAIVRELVRVLRPGGRIALIDVDGYGVQHHPISDEDSASLRTMFDLLAGTGFDPYVGRKLFSFLRTSGLSDVDVHVRPYHVIAGKVSQDVRANWVYKLETLAPLGRKKLGAEAYDRCASSFLRLLDDPDTFTYSVLMVAVGTR